MDVQWLPTGYECSNEIDTSFDTLSFFPKKIAIESSCYLLGVSFALNPIRLPACSAAFMPVPASFDTDCRWCRTAASSIVDDNAGRLSNRKGGNNE